jgi:hypothetical protein
MENVCADSKSNESGDDDKYDLTEAVCFACALANVRASGEYCLSILMTLSKNRELVLQD